ncbi:ankyrin repeat domain-containing protein [Carnobacterium divergens]|uniref:ankyrin repeat domain-containing protein n=1 Tax=Carnobacterium divergens TaxID=2748 RepID=UPI00288EBFED|nr:ankyrin repeat domain-containing protein [Carnobacterium divergens]MDT1996319.1 ankyrin repeat domain-containing protein [Carnobacterium divergens]
MKKENYWQIGSVCFIVIIFILFAVTTKLKEDKKTERVQSESTLNSSHSSNKKELKSTDSVAELKKEPRATPELNQELLTRARIGTTESIQKLIEDGADLTTINEKGASTLLIATQENNIATAKALLEAGADVNQQDQLQDSPFLYAGAEGRFEILTLMLDKKPNYNLLNRYGGTALIPAAEKGHVDNVRLLLEKTPIDVNHINQSGWTALLEAIVLSDGGETQQEIIQLLLEHGADPNKKDSRGISPLTYAKQKGYGRIATMLVEYGGQE